MFSSDIYLANALVGFRHGLVLAARDQLKLALGAATRRKDNDTRRRVLILLNKSRKLAKLAKVITHRY